LIAFFVILKVFHGARRSANLNVKHEDVPFCDIKNEVALTAGSVIGKGEWTHAVIV
jgi:hypothetical protein